MLNTTDLNFKSIIKSTVKIESIMELFFEYILNNLYDDYENILIEMLSIDKNNSDNQIEKNLTYFKEKNKIKFSKKFYNAKEIFLEDERKMLIKLYQKMSEVIMSSGVKNFYIIYKLNAKVNPLPEYKFTKIFKFLNSEKSNNKNIMNDIKKFEHGLVMEKKNLNKLLWREAMITNGHDDCIKLIIYGEHLCKMLLSILKDLKVLSNITNVIESDCYKILIGIEETINLNLKSVDERLQGFEKWLESKFIFKKNLSFNLFNWAFLVYDLKIDNLEKIFSNKKKFFIKESYEVDYEEQKLQIKKDCILHEISTIQEIKKHSIEPLKKYNINEVSQLVNYVDLLFFEIESTLTDFNIDKILPEPHQMYNSKEHNILSAENSVDFKKGEIIKCITCGFKENQKLLVKATVICAK